MIQILTMLKSQAHQEWTGFTNIFWVCLYASYGVLAVDRRCYRQDLTPSAAVFTNALLLFFPSWVAPQGFAWRPQLHVLPSLSRLGSQWRPVMLLWTQVLPELFSTSHGWRAWSEVHASLLSGHCLANYRQDTENTITRLWLCYNTE